MNESQQSLSQVEMKLQIGTDQIRLEYSVADVGEHSENVVHVELSTVCLDTQGRQLWQHNQGDIIVGLSVRDDYIIVQDFAGRKRMIDRFTGQLLTPVMP